MNAVVYWVLAAAVLVVFAGLIGRHATYLDHEGNGRQGSWLGILIDDRLRFSLTQFQVVLWTLLLLSLLIGIILARWLSRSGEDPLSITIPVEILTLAGISGGSAVLATATKSTNTAEVRDRMLGLHKPPAELDGIRAAAEKKAMLEEGEPHATRLIQLFMVEDGSAADKVIDVTKFQNFFFTLIAVLAYAGLAASYLASTPVPSGFPSFSQNLLWLIGISHATYLGGKFPKRE